MADIRHEVRIVIPLLAVRTDLHHCGSRFVKLAAGSVIVAPGESDRHGLLTVTHEDEQLLVFAHDLRERGEPLDHGPSTRV